MRGRRRLLRTLLVNIIGWGLALMWISPFVGLVMAAVRPISEIIYGWWSFGEFHFTLSNFINAWTGGLSTYPLSVGVRNSLIIATASTVIPLAAGSLAAYAFARFTFPLKNALFAVIAVLMAIPQMMVAIPLFLLMDRLGLLDTYVGLILLHSAWGTPWIILFLRNFFITLPKELEESAKVDGATDFQIFFKIILPVSLPAILSVIALQFTWVWNDFFYALLTIISPEKYVATQCIVWMKGEYHTPWGLISAGSIITMAFPVAVFFLLQRYYIKGMIGWMVKG